MSTSQPYDRGPARISLRVKLFTYCSFWLPGLKSFPRQRRQEPVAAPRGPGEAGRSRAAGQPLGPGPSPAQPAAPRSSRAPPRPAAAAHPPAAGRSSGSCIACGFSGFFCFFSPQRGERGLATGRAAAQGRRPPAQEEPGVYRSEEAPRAAGSPAAMAGPGNAGWMERGGTEAGREAAPGRARGGSGDPVDSKWRRGSPPPRPLGVSRLGGEEERRVPAVPPRLSLRLCGSRRGYSANVQAGCVVCGVGVR